MQFSNIVLRVAEELGLDSSDDATKLKAWVNEAYRFIMGLRRWPWSIKSSVIQTTPDIETGTASVNAGATAVTLSTGPSSSVATDYMIQFDDESDDWYKITAHTAGETGLTISPAFVGSDNYSAGSYIIRRFYYSLDSDVDEVIDMREMINDRKLSYVDPRDLDLYLPDSTVSHNIPQFYTLLGFDTSQYWRAQFSPIPTEKHNIHYRFYKRTTDLSADADVPNLPPKWQQAIIFVALATYGHPYIDDDRRGSAEQRARMLLKEMIAQVQPVPDNFPVIQRMDRRKPARPIGPQWPSTFEPRYY